MPHRLLIAGAAAERIELRGRPVRLEADPAKVWPRWMQIAGEGLYLGHPSGPFDFNARIFAEIQKNFRALPEYKQGADGVGTARVIPYDWRHASEQSAHEGGASAIAAQAAQGWIWDLDVRTTPEGKLGLFAYSEALEPAKTLIDEGKIAWTSVCVWPDSVDRVTGQKIGCYLSSVAWTNDPFVRGMVAVSTPIAADAGRQYVDYYEIPSCASELVEALRALFGLAVQAPLADVLRELMTLRACASGQMEAPPGVDVVRLVGCLRRLFNLETIAPPADVFARCDLLLGAVAAEEALVEGAEPPSSKLPPITAAARRAARPTKDPTMDINALLSLLAAPLKCSPTIDSIAAHAPLFFAKAEAESKKGGDAEGKLSAILSALGMGPEDAGAAIDKIKSTMAAAKALEDAMPELAEMYAAAADGEESEAKGDVAMAAERLAHLPEAIRGDALFGICAARDGGVDLPKLPKPPEKADVKATTEWLGRLRIGFTALRTRKAARDTFRQKMGAERVEAELPPKKHRALFEHFANPGAGNGPGPVEMSRANGGRHEDNSAVIDLSDQGDLAAVGGNPVDRAMFVVKRDKLAPDGATYDQIHEAACRLTAEWRAATQGMSAGSARF